MRILSNGNIGIGTTSPTQKLHITGNIYSTGYGRFDEGVQVDSNIAIYHNNSNHRAYYPNNSHYGYFSGYKSDGTRGFYLGYGNGSNMVNLKLDNASRLDITGGDVYMSWKLGVGTTAPTQKLDVAGSIATNNYLFVKSWPGYGTGAGQMWYDGAGGSGSSVGKFNIGANATHMTIQTNGNIGIGTTAPTKKLDVYGYVKGRSGLCMNNDCKTS